jgi:hypothetical protein
MQFHALPMNGTIGTDECDTAKLQGPIHCRGH